MNFCRPAKTYPSDIQDPCLSSNGPVWSTPLDLVGLVLQEVVPSSVAWQQHMTCLIEITPTSSGWQCEITFEELIIMVLTQSEACPNSHLLVAQPQ